MSTTEIKSSFIGVAIVAGMAARRLRLGVIGLGRLWEARHKPALARLKDRFQVVALYDQVARRAELEARQLGCRAIDGLSALVHSPDVDAIAWLTPQWFGAHAVELAARAGKPIYCGVPLPDDAAGLARLEQLGREIRPTLMVEFPFRFYPAMRRLLELSATTLGSIRAVSGSTDLEESDRSQSLGPSTRIIPGSILTAPGQSWVDSFRFLLKKEVAWASEGSPTQATSPIIDGELRQVQFLLGFDGIDWANVLLTHGSANEAPGAGSTLLVTGEHGQAHVNWPDQIRWNDQSGEHEERLPEPAAIGEVLLDQFWRLVHGEEHTAPTWDDALIAARTISALRGSLGSGQRTDLGPATSPVEPSAGLIG